MHGGEQEGGHQECFGADIVTLGGKTREAEPKLWNANYLKVWSANFLLYFAFYLIGPLLPLFLRDGFGADKATIGLVLSGYTITALVIRLFSGYIVDTFPRKKVLLLFYASFAFLFAGYFITSSLFLFALIRTLHGAPFGATTVAASTMAIDVLHPQRRAEGIGYYGLSNNIAMAIGPSVGLLLYHATGNYNVLFGLSLCLALIGLVVDSTIKCTQKQPVPDKKVLSLDRFILVKAWSQGICVMCLAFAFGILTTYVAIYSEERLGMCSGSGAFFALLAIGLIISRLTGGRSLKKGLVVRNASMGGTISLLGYIIFALVTNKAGYLASAFIIGFGQGHFYPAMQTIFINMTGHERRGTANSTILTSWDVGSGVGIILGGVVTELLGGYGSAFWLAVAVQTLGTVWYFAHARASFLKYKVR